MSTAQSDRDDTTPGRGTLLDRILRARESRNPWLLIAALAVFVGFMVLAVRALPEIDKPIRWELIVVALVCVPVIVGLNALEFRLMAHFAQHHPPMLEIGQITVLGSAANLLPMPGAVMVRIANLRRAGVRLRRGLNLSAIIGLAWLGTAGVLGGAVQLWSHTAFALTALAIGGVLLAIGTAMLAGAAAGIGDEAREAISLAVDRAGRFEPDPWGVEVGAIRARWFDDVRAGDGIRMPEA